MPQSRFFSGSGVATVGIACPAEETRSSGTGTIGTTTAKMSGERRHMVDKGDIKMYDKARQTIVALLEESEKTGWTNAIAEEANEFLAPFIEEINSRFGKDLTTDAFLVTAYVVAKDPQCKTRKDFDRLCGLTDRGVHSLISYNLSHFNDNPKNKTAARYIYHKVRSPRSFHENPSQANEGMENASQCTIRGSRNAMGQSVQSQRIRPHDIAPTVRRVVGRTASG